jgi:hypothetical protein
VLADVAGSLLALLRDLRIGLPLLLLSSTALLALLAWPRREPVRAGSERPPRAPERDPYSRTYLSLQHGRFSAVLHEAYDRLDRALEGRTGHRLHTVPWRRAAARRAGIPDPRGLDRCRQRLDRLELWSLQLEQGSYVRLDFWRSRDDSRRRLLARLDPALATVDRYLRDLETPR